MKIRVTKIAVTAAAPALEPLYNCSFPTGDVLNPFRFERVSVIEELLGIILGL